MLGTFHILRRSLKALFYKSALPYRFLRASPSQQVSHNLTILITRLQSNAWHNSAFKVLPLFTELPRRAIFSEIRLPVLGVLGNLRPLYWRVSIRKRIRRCRFHWALCWGLGRRLRSYGTFCWFRVAHHSSHCLPPLGKSNVAIDNGANLCVDVG